MKKLWIVVLLLLTSCASQQVIELRQWSDAAKEDARRGNLLWSEYYKTMYEKVSALPHRADKAFYLRAANALYDAALSMEEGRITKHEFESFQREMQIAEVEYGQKMKERQSAALAQAYSTYLQMQANQAQQWRIQPPLSIRCTSNRMGQSVYTNCH